MNLRDKQNDKTSLLSLQKQIIIDQDTQLNEISKGVSNLRQYSIAVKDESDLHIKLLNDISDDVSKATDGLDKEGEHALKVSKQTSYVKLYVIIAILIVILILLIVLGAK